MLSSPDAQVRDLQGAVLFNRVAAIKCRATLATPVDMANCMAGKARTTSAPTPRKHEHGFILTTKLMCRPDEQADRPAYHNKGRVRDQGTQTLSAEPCSPL